MMLGPSKQKCSRWYVQLFSKAGLDFGATNDLDVRIVGGSLCMHSERYLGSSEYIQSYATGFAQGLSVCRGQ